jgi:hypothetical protein
VVLLLVDLLGRLAALAGVAIFGPRLLAAFLVGCGLGIDRHSARGRGGRRLKLGDAGAGRQQCQLRGLGPRFGQLSGLLFVELPAQEEFDQG